MLPKSMGQRIQILKRDQDVCRLQKMPPVRDAGLSVDKYSQLLGVEVGGPIIYEEIGAIDHELSSLLSGLATS